MGSSDVQRYAAVESARVASSENLYMLEVVDMGVDCGNITGSWKIR